METLEFIKKVEGGKIVIDVPENLEGKEVKVLVMEREADDDFDEKIKKLHELSSDERLKILKQFEGTAKYPDAETNKYDVYD